MKVHFIIPFAIDKDLGRAYNEAMSLIPEGDTACIMDYDVLMLTPETPGIIRQYAEEHPDAMLTCYTNRIHQLSKQNVYDIPLKSDRMCYHIELAKKIQQACTSVTELTENISGFLMVLPKSIWHKHKFKEGIGCLGVDTDYWKKLVSDGIKIFCMNRVYVWHTYRLDKSITDKSHLL